VKRDSKILKPSTWIQETPEGWDEYRIDSIFLNSRRKNSSQGVEAYLSLMANVGVIPFAEKGNVGNKPPEDFGNCKVAKRGDFVLNTMNFGIGSFGIAPQDGILSPVYFVLRKVNPNLDAEFLRFVFSSSAFREYVQMLGSGILEHRAAIRWEKFKTVLVPVPEIQEQKWRAEYLNRETSQIDLLISKKEKLIEKLLERRQTLITQIVTKGLDPNVPVKDSGVDWLGRVPQNWELNKVSYISSRSRIPAADLEIVTAFRDGQVTLRSNRRMEGFTEATQYHGYQRIKPGQVAVHRMDAFAGAIGVSDSEGMCSPVLNLLDCEANLDPRFLALCLREISKSGWIEALAKSVRERTSEFGWSELAAQLVAVPPLADQLAILSYLEEETSQIDILTKKAQLGIKLLKERRQALITQVVTGKLEVRGFAGGDS
jgi:type I restriction enzyme S subunit